MLNNCIKPKFSVGDYVTLNDGSRFNGEILVVRTLGYCDDDNSYYYCCYPKNFHGIDREFKESCLDSCRRN